MDSLKQTEDARNFVVFLFVSVAVVMGLGKILHPSNQPKRDFGAVVEETKVVRLPSYTLIHTDLESVQRACGMTGGVDDAGKPRSEPPPCCFDGQRREMWISYYHEACQVHEDCHAQGVKDCSKVGL